VRPSHAVRSVFDDPNLVSAAGLVPLLRLADAAGLDAGLDGLTVRSPHAATKVRCVVAGMLAGADSIDDLDLLRAGGTGRLFGGLRAPSTLGTFLRSFTHGHVQQLDRAGRVLLSGLAAGVPALLAGGGSRGIAMIDIDDTVREVHGYAKQAAAYGYSGVRGLNVQVATISSPIAAPVIGAATLRRGNTASATGCGRLLAQTISAARQAGVSGRLLVRADSAYYGWALVGTALRHRAWYSITARMTPAVTAAISSIGESAWTPISYPQAVFDDEQQRWISDAEVAEIAFTAFTGRRTSEHVSCRLVVRRVKRLQPTNNDGSSQGELFTLHRHHAFITNSTLSTVEADERHRDHAIVEQVIAELKNGPLAHLPSGNYAANAAWVACAAMAFNLTRAAAVAAGMRTARWATLRTRIINIPGRAASRSRRLTLHLPASWPWASAWEQLWAAGTAGAGPPCAPPA
jgi:hypothetical protein